MARVTPAQASAKWLSRLQSAQTEITNGVNAVQTAPGQLAAAQRTKWLQKVTASQDKWATRVAAVPLATWKDKMITVGIPRISQGAAANQSKVTDFMSQFIPHLDAGVQQLASMPNTTLQDGINRAIAMIQHNASFKRS